MYTKQLFSAKRLIIIITTTVFSFSSMTTAFFLMGIKAVPYFILAALFYFIPYAIIIAEFTGVYKNHIGGLYQWLAGHLSERVAFIASFLWYCSYFIWMISLFMKLWIPFSIVLFGTDLTKQSSSISYINTTTIVGFLSILAICIMLYFVSRGFKGIAFSLYLSGIMMFLLVSICLISGLGLFFQNHGHNLPTFFTTIQSNNPSNQQLLEQLGFLIFAITAFGGLDTIASLVDKTGNQKRHFPKLLIFSSFFIVLCYFLGILVLSSSIDLTTLRTNNFIHLGNLMYELMAFLGDSLGNAFFFSAEQSYWLSQFFIRFTALTLLLSYIGLLSTIFYLPIRTLVEGTPAYYWHPFLKKKNKQNMPVNALIIQGAILSLFILGICFGSKYIVFLYNQLTLMTNISRAIPYLLVALAYPAFKRKPLQSSAKILTHPRKIKLVSYSVITSITLAIFFQIYQPFAEGNYFQSLSLLIGPLLFSIVGNTLYVHFHRKKLLTHSKTD